MITRAAVCPAAPLLARELSGRESVLPDLRDACAGAVKGLLDGDPGIVIVVGAAEETSLFDPAWRLNPADFAPALPAAREGGLPPALGLGARLLDEAGWDGPRVLQSIAATATPGACHTLGRRLTGSRDHAALLVMGDGSARRSIAAPGYFDERAAGFDTLTERALRNGDADALMSLDPDLADELMATGRAAWQVLAGALTDTAQGEIRYADAPLGVGYIVAVLTVTRPDPLP